MDSMDQPSLSSYKVIAEIPSNDSTAKVAEPPPKPPPQPPKQPKKTWKRMPEDYTLTPQEAVKAKYHADKQVPYGCSAFKNHFYDGKVTIEEDGTFTVNYDDGAVEQHVVRANLKVYL